MLREGVILTVKSQLGDGPSCWENCPTELAPVLSTSTSGDIVTIHYSMRENLFYSTTFVIQCTTPCNVWLVYCFIATASMILCKKVVIFSKNELKVIRFFKMHSRENEHYIIMDSQWTLVSSNRKNRFWKYIVRSKGNKDYTFIITNRQFTYLQKLQMHLKETQGNQCK